MRNVMIIGLLIVALIIGILMIKDINSGPAPGMKKTEAINRAKQAARQADQETQKVRDAIRNAQNALPDHQ